MQMRTARVAGALWILATVAGALSVVALGGFAAEGVTLANAPTAADAALGALAVLVMAMAVSMIPAVMFPILKRHSEALAIGYVVARGLEVAAYLPGAIGPLLLAVLGAEYVDGGASGAAYFDTLRTLLVALGQVSAPFSMMFFCLSLVILNYLLVRMRLVPRFIPIWGLVATGPYLLDGVLGMFGLIAVSSLPHALLVLPVAVNEMVLAVWLIAKGFTPSPVVAAGVVQAETANAR